MFPLPIWFRRVPPHNETITHNPPNQPLGLLLRRRRKERRRSFFYPTHPLDIGTPNNLDFYLLRKKKRRTRYRRPNLPLKRRRGDGTVGRPRPFGGASTGHSEDMAGEYRDGP